jgi:hypothetical protein
VTNRKSRATIGHDHGYDVEVFYLGGPRSCVRRGFRGGGLIERIGEDNPGGEDFFRDIWEEGDVRDFVLEALKSGVEVRPGRPPV